jgi:hypothetical protein
MAVDEATVTGPGVDNGVQVPEPGKRKSGGEVGMPQKSTGPSVKDKKMYEELRKKGDSKQKAARIANSAAKSSRSSVGKKGGKGGDYDDWSKTQLMEKAKQVGITGRSSMSKSELVKALRNH